MARRQRIDRTATHHLDYGVPDGPIGTVVDLVLMRPLLTVGIGLLGRRLARWIESAP